MNPQSKLLLIIGVFVLTETCSGQRPPCKEPMMHFTADIISVDSILSESAYHKQRALRIPLRDLKSEKDSAHFELIRGRIKRKKGSVCPMIIETGRPEKI